MIRDFEIVTSKSPRPAAERIVFCDGGGAHLFREETDLELSHWRPNRTPREYRAGTSTEICFRFLEDPRGGPWTVAVNNHLDVDGILSVYVLVHSAHTREHRKTIVAAAEMGDFWGWGEDAAQRLFQGLTLMMDAGRERGDDVRKIYEDAFARIPGLIEGSDPRTEAIEQSLAPLNRGMKRVEQRKIRRSLIGERLAHYIIPLDVAGDDECAAYVPGFNEAISDKTVLWPQARARWDKERVCLVSTQRSPGWFHALWFPGYLWADTESLWQVPGMHYRDGMESYDLDLPPLTTALERLQTMERGVGLWTMAGGASPFHETLQSIFPVVSRFADSNGAAAVSLLPPEDVGNALAGVFDG
jgi:hypothetical protein